MRILLFELLNQATDESERKEPSKFNDDFLLFKTYFLKVHC